jgi:hypothetical protein
MSIVTATFRQPDLITALLCTAVLGSDRAGINGPCCGFHSMSALAAVHDGAIWNVSQTASHLHRDDCVSYASSCFTSSIPAGDSLAQRTAVQHSTAQHHDGFSVLVSFQAQCVD